MKNIDIFLVLFPVGYLNIILNPETNKVLKYPLDLGEFMTWVGYWLYMPCWVGIPKRHNWWSVTLPVMHIEAPFRLKIHVLPLL